MGTFGNKNSFTDVFLYNRKDKKNWSQDVAECCRFYQRSSQTAVPYSGLDLVMIVSQDIFYPELPVTQTQTQFPLASFLPVEETTQKQEKTRGLNNNNDEFCSTESQSKDLN